MSIKPKALKVSDVFVANDTPTITYVDRASLNLEFDLSQALAMPKIVVSISGPSKTGKTVLINKVVNRDYVIPAVGTGIKNVDDIWNRVLQWMEVPTSFSSSKSEGVEAGGGGKTGLSVNTGIAKASTEINASAKESASTSELQTRSSSGIMRVISEIGNSDFIVFIDDFHYIDENIRNEAGRQIKVAADNGVKILTAPVPHRSDDVVRSNPELRGRVAGIDIGRWDDSHLREIAEKGFTALNVRIPSNIISRLVTESIKSPQLMQTLCFCLCQVLNIEIQKDSLTSINVTDAQFQKALRRTAQFTDFSKMVTQLHSGPPTRGTERKIHQLIDGSRGDVYRATLLALKQDPLQTSFSYGDISARLRRVCIGDAPAGSSINSCLEKMHEICETLQPGAPVLAWDGDTLDVVDPYFAFFLRCSDKLSQLERK